MSIKKLGPKKWLIKISVRVPGRDETAKKQETFFGTKIEAVQRKAEIIKSIRNPKSCSLKSKEKSSKKYFKNILSVYKDNLRITGQLSKDHENKIDFIEKKPITAHRYQKGEETPRDRYLSDDERSRIITAVVKYRHYLLPFIQYNLAVPCRKSELIRALKTQYNYFTNTISIPDSKARIPINKPVPPSMIEYFRNIPDACPYLFYREIKGSRKDRPGKNKRYVAIGDFKKAWAYCLKKAEVSDVHIHDLRHISATDLYAAGVSEREIMDIAGWMTPMLSDYRHKDSLRTAQKINKFFEQRDGTN